MECMLTAWSFIVAVLSILVVALISWQIYSIIDIRKIRKEVEDKRQAIVYEADRSALLSFVALSDFYYELLVKTSSNEKEFKYLHYRISALVSASRIKDYEYCNAIVRALLETIVEEHLKLRKYNRQLLVALLLSVKEQNKIQDFQTLLQKILNIPEVEAVSSSARPSAY